MNQLFLEKRDNSSSQLFYLLVFYVAQGLILLTPKGVNEIPPDVEEDDVIPFFNNKTVLYKGDLVSSLFSVSYGSLQQNYALFEPKKATNPSKSISLLNTNQELTQLDIDYSLDAAQVEIYAGFRGLPLENYELVYKGKVSNLHYEKGRFSIDTQWEMEDLTIDFLKCDQFPDTPDPTRPLQIILGNHIQGTGGQCDLIKISDNEHFASWWPLGQITSLWYRGKRLNTQWEVRLKTINEQTCTIVYCDDPDLDNLQIRCGGVVDESITGSEEPVRFAHHLIELLLKWMGKTPLEVFDKASWLHFSKLCLLNHIVLGGVVTGKKNVQELFGEMLKYLFHIHNDGSLLSIISEFSKRSTPQAFINADQKGVSVAVDKSGRSGTNIINKLKGYFSYNWSSKKYHRVTRWFQDLDSIKKYKREIEHELQHEWVRDLHVMEFLVVQKLQQTKDSPRIFNLTYTGHGLFGLPYNGVVAISGNDILGSTLDGLALINALCEIKRITVDFMTGGKTTLVLAYRGDHLSQARELIDFQFNTTLGERDLSEYDVF